MLEEYGVCILWHILNFSVILQYDSDKVVTVLYLNISKFFIIFKMDKLSLFWSIDKLWKQNRVIILN